MSLLTCGLNHNSAPMSVREKLAYPPSAIPVILHEIKEQGLANEAVLLSTCNRTELYCDQPDPKPVMDWFCQKHALTSQELSRYIYIHHDFDAIKHLMRVTSGLDSLVLGESEILGQVKKAVNLAQQAGTIGDKLQHLFNQIFAATKQVRTATDIGTNSISVAYTGICLAKKHFQNLSQLSVLLIGAGDTIELAARHLSGQSIKQLFIANRTFSRANDIAQKFKATPLTLQSIPEQLLNVDIVITATSSPLPFISKILMDRIMLLRQNRTLLMIDLAMPRDIEPTVSTIDGLALYSLDDLQQIITEHTDLRKNAAEQAEAIIEWQSHHIIRELQARKTSAVIATFRKQIESLRDQEMAKAIQQLKQGIEPEQVLHYFGHGLSQKLLHWPTVQIRQAGYDNQQEILEMIHRLFNQHAALEVTD